MRVQHALTRAGHLPGVVSNADASVRVRLAAIDAEVLHLPGAEIGESVTYVGEVEDIHPSSSLRVGDQVVGVGPLVNRLPVRARDIVSSPAECSPQQAVLIPTIASILAAVRALRIAPGDRVMISGWGLAAVIADLLVSRRPGVQTVRYDGALRASNGPADVHREFDVAIDTTADPASWERCLDLVTEGGRAGILLPPGAHRHPFDVYANLHRRSLTLSAWRVPSHAWEVGSTNAVGLVRLLRNDLEQALELAPLHVSALGSRVAAQLDRPNGGSHGILVTWTD